VLDLCGGPGNLGLALALRGYGDYLLGDIDTTRMRWGEIWWKRCGRKLAWQPLDVTKIALHDRSFDVVCLLGWEAPSLPYFYVLKECLRVLRPGGHLLFTYHEERGIVEGNWDFDPERTYSYLPYSIGKEALHLLCERLGTRVLHDEEGWDVPAVQPFFPDRTPRLFPQRLLVCSKGDAPGST